jgi:hypothetical protein
MVDPEAAARVRIQRQERKATGRKRKMEEFKRMRLLGLPIKNVNKRHKGKRQIDK